VTPRATVPDHWPGPRESGGRVAWGQFGDTRLDRCEWSDRSRQGDSVGRVVPPRCGRSNCWRDQTVWGSPTRERPLGQPRLGRSPRAPGRAVWAGPCWPSARRVLISEASWPAYEKSRCRAAMESFLRFPNFDGLGSDFFPASQINGGFSFCMATITWKRILDLEDRWGRQRVMASGGSERCIGEAAHRRIRASVSARVQPSGTTPRHWSPTSRGG